MELLIIIGLVLLNGIFSMSEMALVSARKFKLTNARDKGRKDAGYALALSENPNRFFSTVQIGITLIGVLLGIYSGENITDDVEGYLAQVEWIRPYAHNVAVGGVVIFVTYLSIVLGELLPKRLGLTFPEPIAILLARPMMLLSTIAAPFVWLLTATNDLLLSLLGIRNKTQGRVTEEELRLLIRESADKGEIQQIEQHIVERVFELGDRKVNALMTHRKDIVFFDTTDQLDDVRRIVGLEKHSAYPVCQHGDLDDVVGLVLLKDLIEPMLETPFTLTKHLRKPLFITEGTFAYKLLESFKREKLHYAIVVDEFGSTRGMVTMDDVLDALVGDMSEHGEDEYKIISRDAGCWFVDGLYPAGEFMRFFDLKQETANVGEYVTVAGLFIEVFHGLPDVGDKVNFQGYTLEVVDKDGQRIDKILVSKDSNQ